MRPLSTRACLFYAPPPTLVEPHRRLHHTTDALYPRRPRRLMVPFHAEGAPALSRIGNDRRDRRKPRASVVASQLEGARWTARGILSACPSPPPRPPALAGSCEFGAGWAGLRISRNPIITSVSGSAKSKIYGDREIRTKEKWRTSRRSACESHSHTKFFEEKVRQYSHVTSTEPRHFRRAHGGGLDG